jgi:hypothetical protein
MFFDFSFTVPKTATANDPEVMECPLCYGIIHRITLFWWPGPHGLVHVTVNRALHQLLPTNPEESFHYDNYTHVMDERIPLLEAPYQIELKGWADDCDYDHEVKVGVGILPPESFPEYQKPDTALDLLLKALHLK